MKDIIYKILFCVGTVISVGYVFIPAGEGMFEDSSFVFGIINRNPAVFMGFENITLFNNVPIILVLIIYWIPSIFLVASAILIFMMPKNKISFILTAVAACIFIASDIICLVNDTVYIGIFVNLVGVILSVASIALLFIEEDDETEEVSANESYGVVRCLSGEYEGGKFYIRDKLTIGHDASKCNVILSDKTISRVHCVITYVTETDTYTVKDLSKNGTFFADGKRFARNFDMQVPRSTEIYMGGNRERFVLE